MAYGFYETKNPGKQHDERTFNISIPILAGLSVTITPAFSKARTLSTAAPGKNKSQNDE